MESSVIPGNPFLLIPKRLEIPEVVVEVKRKTNEHQGTT